jgi:hypothetical protein
MFACILFPVAFTIPHPLCGGGIGEAGIMEFVGNIVDFGTAPEIPVFCIARAELVSPNVIRVSYAVPYTIRNGDSETVEHRIVCHFNWDLAMWPLAGEATRAAITAIVGAEHENLFLAPTSTH